MELPARDDIQGALEYVISGGGEFAEFFFESTLTNSVFCEDSKVERVMSGNDDGFGLRVITGNRTIYACSNDVGREELFRLGREAVEEMESGSAKTVSPGALREGETSGVARGAESVPMEQKTSLVLAADRAARNAGEEISQVQVNYRDSLRQVNIYNSDGDAVRDERRQVVYSVRAIATDGTILQTAGRAAGGRVGFEFFDRGHHESLAAEAGESALMILHARHAPAGVMTVVLGSQAGGTMIHEAIGHGLEGDAAEKNLSIYSGKVGETVAAQLITVIDDATLAGKRGSYRFDDEGVDARRTVLVDGGELKGYLLDRLTAKRMNLVSTGNGRRESYRHRPIVRMSNTMIAPGAHDPGEIMASVDRGLFVARMGGGQVDTTSGDFVFKVSEAYIIENGKITEPVRGATLIGNGPAILKEIDMVGNDLGFDIGTCGKDGQHVPVADAQPTLRIPAITVGGEV